MSTHARQIQKIKSLVKITVVIIVTVMIMLIVIAPFTKIGTLKRTCVIHGLCMV